MGGAREGSDETPEHHPFIIQPFGVFVLNEFLHGPSFRGAKNWMENFPGAVPTATVYQSGNGRKLATHALLRSWGPKDLVATGSIPRLIK